MSVCCTSRRFISKLASQGAPLKYKCVFHGCKELACGGRWNHKKSRYSKLPLCEKHAEEHKRDVQTYKETARRIQKIDKGQHNCEMVTTLTLLEAAQRDEAQDKLTFVDAGHRDAVPFLLQRSLAWLNRLPEDLRRNPESVSSASADMSSLIPPCT